MKRYDNIMQDNTIAPKTDNNLWLKDDQLYYYTNGGWRLIGGGSGSETDYNDLKKSINELRETLKQAVSTNVGDGIDNLNEIKSFLEGFSDKENLKEKLDQIESNCEDLSWQEV